LPLDKSTATTLVFSHRPAALDYGIKHVNPKIFVTPPKPQKERSGKAATFLFKDEPSEDESGTEYGY